MNSEIKSETNYNGNVIPQTDWIEASYHHNLQDGPKKEPETMPNLRHQKVQRPKQPKPNPVVPARGSTKAAAEAVHKANKADLQKKNIR